jgi:hypothetical protein
VKEKIEEDLLKGIKQEVFVFSKEIRNNLNDINTNLVWLPFELLFQLPESSHMFTYIYNQMFDITKVIIEYIFHQQPLIDIEKTSVKHSKNNKTYTTTYTTQSTYDIDTYTIYSSCTTQCTYNVKYNHPKIHLKPKTKECYKKLILSRSKNMNQGQKNMNQIEL